MMSQTSIKAALIVGACFTGLMSLPVAAETAHSDQYYACLDNIDDSAFRNSQLDNCVEGELERQDVVLNREEAFQKINNQPYLMLKERG